MMDIALAVLFYIFGAISGALLAYAWLSDRMSIADYEPTEHGETPL